MKRESLFLERESQFDSQLRPLSSLYGQERPLSGLRPTGLGRNVGALVTQVSFCLLVYIWSIFTSWIVTLYAFFAC